MSYNLQNDHRKHKIDKGWDTINFTLRNTPMNHLVRTILENIGGLPNSNGLLVIIWTNAEEFF